MNNITKYKSYYLLAVVVFTIIWLIGGFISMEFDMVKWEAGSRFLLVAFTIIIIIPIIGYKES